jgi:hypothetical protein
MDNNVKLISIDLQKNPYLLAPKPDVFHFITQSFSNYDLVLMNFQKKTTSNEMIISRGGMGSQS